MLVLRNVFLRLLLGLPPLEFWPLGLLPLGFLPLGLLPLGLLPPGLSPLDSHLLLVVGLRSWVAGSQVSGSWVFGRGSLGRWASVVVGWAAQPC